MRKEVRFEDSESESESEYDSEDEFYDDDDDDEGGGYQLASDYDIEYDDDDDDEGGVLYGGVRKKKKKKVVKKRKRSAYNRFVALWAKKKKPGTKRYYNIKEIAAMWRKKHGLVKKRKSKGGSLYGGVAKKKSGSKTSKKGKKKAIRKPTISLESILKAPQLNRYLQADKYCNQMGQNYCPLSQSCVEDDEMTRCMAKAGISYVTKIENLQTTDGKTITRRLIIPLSDDGAYVSPAEALKWWKNLDPAIKRQYDGPPNVGNKKAVADKYKSYLGNVPLGPIYSGNAGLNGIQRMAGLTNTQVAILNKLGVDIGDPNAPPGMTTTDVSSELSEISPALQMAINSAAEAAIKKNMI